MGSPLAGLKVAVIGAGNMAEALIGGAITRGVLKADQVTAADPSEPRLKVFESLGVSTAVNNSDAAGDADVVVLAVKPQKSAEVLSGLAPGAAGKLFVSIMAGVASKTIAAALGGEARVIRTMPNTPLLVGMGATGLAAGPGADVNDMARARALFEASGLAIQMHEAELDAVTAVSGSGPAYLFYLAEAMMKAAQAEGLTAGASRDLVSSTLRGAAELLVAGGDKPEELRRRVTSPGGTTEAAVEVLDSSGVKDKLVAAVRRAAERSRELGK